jgi:hypothetical protein
MMKMTTTIEQAFLQAPNFATLKHNARVLRYIAVIYVLRP